MPVDTSMYPRPAQVAPMNPFTAMGQAAGITNALNQNRLFQQEFQDRAGFNALMSAAPTDPNSGMIDIQKTIPLAQSMGLGRQLPQVIQQLQQMDTTQTQLLQSKLKLANERYGTIMKMVAPAISDPNLTVDKASKLILQVQKDFNIPYQVTGGLLSELTKMNSPEEVKQFITQRLWMPTLDAQTQNQIINGIISQRPLGGTVQTIAATPQGVRVLDEAKMTLTPEAAAAAVPVMTRGPKGELIPSSISQAQALEMRKGGPLMTGAPLTPEGLTPGEAYGRLVDVYDPKTKQMLQIPLQEVLKKAGYSAPTEANEQTTPIVKTPPLGKQTAEEKFAGDSAQAMSDHLKSVIGSKDRVFQLNEINTLLNDVRTGRGTEALNAMRSYALNAGMGDEAKVANFDKLTKYISQYATQRAKGFGSGTDMQLGTVLSGNPNTHMTTLANKDLVKALIGLERMDQALAQGASAENVQPENFSKWAADWATKIDPRAFLVDMLPPDKRQKLLDGLKGQAREKFKNSYDLAVRSGLVQGLQ